MFRWPKRWSLRGKVATSQRAKVSAVHYMADGESWNGWRQGRDLVRLAFWKVIHLEQCGG